MKIPFRIILSGVFSAVIFYNISWASDKDSNTAIIESSGVPGAKLKVSSNREEPVIYSLSNPEGKMAAASSKGRVLTEALALYVSKTEGLSDLGSLSGEKAYERGYQVLWGAEDVADQRKGLACLHHSAETFYSKALYDLSLHYETGFPGCIEKNPTFARQLCEAAADTGHHVAQMLIANAYLAGGYDLKVSDDNRQQGLQLLRQYASSNEAARRKLEKEEDAEVSLNESGSDGESSKSEPGSELGEGD